ncbi:MAG: hypothetical protein MZV70_47140 [Desulfobacterales bacterium]|nr:hypothetical protein [Desulfobacterales bacterium]
MPYVLSPRCRIHCITWSSPMVMKTSSSRLRRLGPSSQLVMPSLLSPPDRAGRHLVAGPG